MPQRSTAAPPLKAAHVAALIQEMNGNLTAVARRLGCSRKRLYRFIEQHPTLQDELTNARESMLDNAESVLYRKVLSGEDTTALIFFLKTQGYKRGYVEKHEHTGPDGSELKVQLRWSENDSDQEQTN
jgi:hypothetical protein